MTPDPRIPDPEGPNADFYARAAGGVLHLQRCADCGSFQHPPRYRCGACASGAVEWVASEGRGHLYSWTVTHVPFDRGWADEVPYVTVVVELDEGVRLIGAVADLPAAQLALGLAMVASVEPRGEAFAFLTFRPS